MRVAIQINRGRPAKPEDDPAPYEIKIAALIERETAAPELLAALLGAMETIRLYAEQSADTPFDATNFDAMRARMEQARAAIAKATA